MKYKFYKIAIMLAIFLLPSCSVFMAANKKGVSLEELSKCHTRGCLLSKGAISINLQKNKAGTLISEVFKAQKPQGSAARAAMHGVLDVATFGIWEVAGTPMEGVMNKNEMYAFKVWYKENGEDIKNVQINQ